MSAYQKIVCEMWFISSSDYSTNIFFYRLGIDIDNLSDLDSDEDSETSLPGQEDSSPIPSNEDSCDPYPQNDDISKQQDTQDNLNTSEHKNMCDGDSKDMQKTEINKKQEQDDVRKDSITQSETSIGLLDSLKKVPPQINTEEVKETYTKVGKDFVTNFEK